VKKFEPKEKVESKKEVKNWEGKSGWRKGMEDGKLEDGEGKMDGFFRNSWRNEGVFQDLDGLEDGPEELAFLEEVSE
jgi:hypothetical protein